MKGQTTVIKRKKRIIQGVEYQPKPGENIMTKKTGRGLLVDVGSPYDPNFGRFTQEIYMGEGRTRTIRPQFRTTDTKDFTPEQQQVILKGREPEEEERRSFLNQLIFGLETEEEIKKGIVPITGIAGIAGATGALIRGAKGGLVKQGALPGRGPIPIAKALKLKPKTAAILSRYPTNIKSLSLTNRFLIGAGMSLGTAGIAVGAIGSYPFAGFIKEEALQTLAIPVQSAIFYGDYEGAAMQTAAIDELINAQDTILNKIPYANVYAELQKFFKAAEISNNQWKRTIAEAAKKQEEGGE